MEETKALADILKLGELGVPKDFEADMKVVLETMVRYAQFCEISTRVMYHVVYAQMHRDRLQEEKALKAIEDLYQIADLIEEEQKGTHYPYYLYARLQPLRIRLFADSAAKQLREKARYPIYQPVCRGGSRALAAGECGQGRDGDL